MQTGIIMTLGAPQNGRIDAFGLEAQGFRNLKRVHWNLAPAALYEEAMARGEGHLAKNGPLVVLTGLHTGRSATDKFVVRDATTEHNVWWDNNKPMSRRISTCCTPTC